MAQSIQGLQVRSDPTNSECAGGARPNYDYCRIRSEQLMIGARMVIKSSVGQQRWCMMGIIAMTSFLAVTIRTILCRHGAAMVMLYAASWPPSSN